MDAKEARDKAMSIKFGKAAVQYDIIKAEIEKAAEDGKFECYFSEHIMDSVENRLREEGFDVNSFEGRMGDITVTIRW